MNLIETFQDLVAQVSDLVQPIIVALAGAVPFIEGEGAAAIGIVGGIHPAIAAAAAIIGNYLCVAVLVLLSSRAREAVVTHNQERRKARELVLDRGDTSLEQGLEITANSPNAEKKPSSRKVKFQGALSRYGVPGVSLLGPLLLPTQFTATMLAAAGIGKARILFWQGLAIIGWTTIISILVSGVLYSAS